MNKVLSVIAVNWNSHELLDNCLESFFKNLCDELIAKTEVVVVDNNSEVIPIRIVERYKTKIDMRLIKNGENLGFSKAVNRGLRHINGKYVLLLNPDILFPGNFDFLSWINFMDNNPNVAVSGPKLLNPDMFHQIGDAGYRPSFVSILLHFLFLSKITPLLNKGVYLSEVGDSSTVIFPDWVCGALMLIRRSFLNEIRGFPEDEFMYGEDIEVCLKAKRAGFRVAYIPYLCAVHIGGATSKEAYSTAWLRSLKNVYIKEGGGKASFKVILFFGLLFRVLIYSSFSLFDKKKVKKREEMLYYLIRLNNL